MIVRTVGAEVGIFRSKKKCEGDIEDPGHQKNGCQIEKYHFYYGRPFSESCQKDKSNESRYYERVQEK